MIAALCVSALALVIFAVDKFLALRKEIRILKAGKAHEKAKEIVETKTSSELADDFNKRYPGDGSGADDRN